MEKKAGFEKKLTLDEMMKKHEEVKKKGEMVSAIDYLAHKIDEETEKAIVEVAQEMGYEARAGMTLEEASELHKKMLADGYYLNTSTEQVGSKYVVTVSIVQTARVLEFDLTGGEDDES